MSLMDWLSKCEFLGIDCCISAIGFQRSVRALPCYPTTLRGKVLYVDGGQSAAVCYVEASEHT